MTDQIDMLYLAVALHQRIDALGRLVLLRGHDERCRKVTTSPILNNANNTTLIIICILSHITSILTSKLVAVHTVTNHIVAMKYISKAAISREKTKNRVKREYDYMRLLKHPHIIKLCVSSRLERHEY